MPAKKRCTFRRTKSGHFQFRRGGVKKCHPKPATLKKHRKLFGDSGGPGHKAYAKAVYETRVQSIARARAAPRRGGPSKKFLAAQKIRLDKALASM